MNDILSCKKFNNAIARCNYPVDIHSNHPGNDRLTYLKADDYYEIPLGCIENNEIKWEKAVDLFDLDSYGNEIYAINSKYGNEIISIYDISNIQSIQLLSSPGGNFDGMCLNDSLLYGVRSGSPNSLYIINVSDPENPS